MATTFTNAKAAAGVQARVGLDTITVFAEHEISAALVVNDVIQMVKVPAGAVILDVKLASDDLDSAGPAIVLDVGDGTVTDRFIDGATVAQGSGVTSLNEVDGLLYEYTAEDTIDILVQVAPATGATSGTLRLAVTYTMQS